MSCLADPNRLEDVMSLAVIRVIRVLGLRRFKFFVFLMLSVLRYLDRVWSFSLSLSLSQSHSSVPAPVAGYGMVPGPIIERWCPRCL